MINRLIITTAMTILAGTAFAAPPPVVWVGGFLIQAATPQVACDAVNAQKNELYTAVFHPKLAGDATVARDAMQILQHQKATRVSPTTVNFAANGNYTGTI